MPKKQDNREKVAYVRFNNQEWSQLKTLADQNGLDRSNVIRLALKNLVATSSASGHDFSKLFYEPETNEA